MDIESVFLDISKKYTLDNEENSKECYLNCQKYAKENIDNILLRNEFVYFCSTKLNQTFIHEMFFPAVSKTEIILVKHEGNKITIYANKPGLKYLIASMTMLYNSNLSGEHIHIDKDEDINLVSKNEFEIMFMNDQWFSKYQTQQTIERVFTERKIDIYDICTIVFMSPIPPFLSEEINQYEPYKVIGTSQFDQNIVKKSIRKSDNRMIRVDILGNKNIPFPICIDLDDDEICFLTQKQLKTIIR